MKKLSKVTALLLVVVSALSFVACSNKYGALKSAFEKAEWQENSSFTGVAETIKEELAKEEYEVELHLFTKKSNGVSSALIVEFKATKELVQAYKDNEMIRDLVAGVTEDEDVNKIYNTLVEKGYAKGNCLVVPMSILYASEITDIVKSVK